MASERTWAAVSQAFTADGTADGVIKVANVKGFKVKAVVLLSSSAFPKPLSLEIKAIPDETTIQVGPAGSDMTVRQDISLYLVSDSATLTQQKQKRPGISLADFTRAVYEEEPTVAIRTILVDDEGDAFDENNPIPIVFDGTIQIGNVRITQYDNDPLLGDIHSSVRIGDGTNTLKINPDGSVNVVIPPGGGGIAVNAFNQISSVPANALTTILSYTIPPGYIATLFRVEIGGSNVATYELYINGSIEARKRIWFSGPLTDIFEFSSGASGFKMSAGDVLEVKVVHTRPDVGDFEARIQAELQ